MAVDDIELDRPPHVLVVGTSTGSHRIRRLLEREYGPDSVTLIPSVDADDRVELARCVVYTVADVDAAAAIDTVIDTDERGVLALVEPSDDDGTAGERHDVGTADEQHDDGSVGERHDVGTAGDPPDEDDVSGNIENGDVNDGDDGVVDTSYEAIAMAAFDAGVRDVVRADAPTAILSRRLSNVLATIDRGAGRETVDRYRRLHAAADVAVLVTTDLEVSWASVATTRVLATTPQDLVGTVILDRIVDADHDAISSTAARVSENDLDATERIGCRIRHGDGVIRPHLVTITNRLADPVIGGLVWTVTPSLRSLEEWDLGAAEARPERPDEESAGSVIVEGIDDPAVFLDEDWTVRARNEAAQAVFGASGDPLDESVFVTIPPGSVTEWFERLSEARLRSTSIRFDTDVFDDDTFDADVFDDDAFDVANLEGDAYDAEVFDEEAFDAEVFDRDEDDVGFSRGSAEETDEDSRTTDETRTILRVTAVPVGSSMLVVATPRTETVDDVDMRLETLAELLDAVPGPAFVVGEDDRVSIANAATFGYADRDVVIGLPVAELVGSDVAARIAERADAGVRRVDPIEWQPTGADGPTVDLGVVPVSSGETAVVGRDVTSEVRWTSVVGAIADAVDRSAADASLPAVRRTLLDGVRFAFDRPAAIWYVVDDDRLHPVASLGPDTPIGVPLERDDAPIDSGGIERGDDRSIDPPPLSIDTERERAILAGDERAVGPVPVGGARSLAPTAVIPIGDGIVVFVGDIVDADAVSLEHPVPDDRQLEDRQLEDRQTEDSPIEDRTPEVESDDRAPSEDVPWFSPDAGPQDGPPLDEMDDVVGRVDRPRPMSVWWTREGSGELVRTTGALLSGVVTVSSALVESERANRTTRRELEGCRHQTGRLESVLDRYAGLAGAVREAGADEGERVSCEVVASLEPVSLAWIATREGDRLVDRTRAGGPTAFLDVLYGADVNATNDPTRLALESASERIVDAVDPARIGEPWAYEATDLDIQSVAAIPIDDGSAEHVLGVATTEPNAFDGHLGTFCRDVADTLGLVLALSSARSARMAGDTVELDVGLALDAEDPLVEIAEVTGAPFSIESVAISPERTTLFCSFENVSEADISELSSIDSVDLVRPVGDDATGLEIVLRGDSILDTLSALDGRLRAVGIEDEQVVLRLEFPSDRSVRDLLQSIRERVPGVELLARRSVAADAFGPSGEALLSALTDRQLEVLRTAHAAGYFAWPRERTGEEVAARLDVSQPTFTRHLRAGERALLDALFERE